MYDEASYIPGIEFSFYLLLKHTFSRLGTLYPELLHLINSFHSYNESQCLLSIDQGHDFLLPTLYLNYVSADILNTLSG